MTGWWGLQRRGWQAEQGLERSPKRAFGGGIGGFYGCQGLGGKRKELGKRPGFSLSLRQSMVREEGLGWARSLFWTLEFLQWPCGQVLEGR